MGDVFNLDDLADYDELTLEQACNLKIHKSSDVAFFTNSFFKRSTFVSIKGVEEAMRRSNRSYCVMFLKHMLKLPKSDVIQALKNLGDVNGPLYMYKKRNTDRFVILYDTQGSVNLKRASHQSVKGWLVNYKPYLGHEVVEDFTDFLKPFNERQRAAIFSTTVLGVVADDVTRQTTFTAAEILELKSSFERIPKSSATDKFIRLVKSITKMYARQLLIAPLVAVTGIVVAIMILVGTYGIDFMDSSRLKHIFKDGIEGPPRSKPKHAEHAEHAKHAEYAENPKEKDPDADPQPFYLRNKGSSYTPQGQKKAFITACKAHYSVNSQTAEQNLRDLRQRWDNITSPDANTRIKSFRRLSIQFHPDKNHDTAECFTMINALNDYYAAYYNQKPTQS